MRCFLLSVSRAAVFCLFIAILRVRALVVIPSEAAPQRYSTPGLRAQGADDAPSERGGPRDWDWDLDLASHSAGPPIPTVTCVLPSHAPWHTQSETMAVSESLGHVPGTQRVLILDDDGTHAREDNAVWQPSHPFPSRARVNDREPRDPRRRQPRPRPDGMGGMGGQHAYTSEDSKVSVLAVAVVGIVLACHYLDYL